MQTEGNVKDIFMSDAALVDGGILPLIRELGVYRGVRGSLRSLRDRIQRITDVTYRNAACYSEVEYLFIKRFLNVPHPFGITLSADVIGSDCHIPQNSTVGTNGKDQGFDGGTAGYKPRLGFCVKVNPGAIVSGPIEVGSFSIVYGNTTLTQSVPPFSVVRGVNSVEPIRHLHQYQNLAHCLYHSLVVNGRPPAGLAWTSKGLLVSPSWRSVQEEFVAWFSHGKLKTGLVDFFEQQRIAFQHPKSLASPYEK